MIGSKKIFFWLINCALFNAFRVYKYQHLLSYNEFFSYNEFLLETVIFWVVMIPERDEKDVEEITLQTTVPQGHCTLINWKAFRK